MLDSIVQQFLGGQAESVPHDQLHSGVGQMIQQAPNESVLGAVEGALGQLGGGGLGQSVAQGAQNATPQQRSALGNILMDAISQGGGSPQSVMSQLGIGGSGSNMGAGELAQLAQHVAENHPGALSSVLGDALNQQGAGSSGGGGLLQLLGNPMVRQVGTQLAQKAFG